MWGITVRRAGGRGKDSGYMLLVLMLAVAVLTITMLGVARNYRRSIVRDREVEMMHRGDQYARAVKRYYKKNGSYPSSLEQLEKTNNIRYLRKRYKDPMSPDGAWKLVHPTDIKLTAAGGLVPSGGGLVPSAGAPPNQTQANANVLGGAASAPTAQNTSANGTSGGTTDTGTTTGNPGGGASGSTGTDNNAATSGQVLGGGPVLGVVSKQAAEGIHVFGDKKKYNEWFFIYDPTQDKGQMLVGPYNPNTFMGATNAGLGNPSSPNSGSPNSGSGVGSAVTPGTVSPNAPSSTPTPSAPMSPTPMQ